MKENSKKRQRAINMTTTSMSLKMREVKDKNEIIDFPDYGSAKMRENGVSPTLWGKAYISTTTFLGSNLALSRKDLNVHTL